MPSTFCNGRETVAHKAEMCLKLTNGIRQRQRPDKDTFCHLCIILSGARSNFVQEMCQPAQSSEFLHSNNTENNIKTALGRGTTAEKTCWKKSMDISITDCNLQHISRNRALNRVQNYLWFFLRVYIWLRWNKLVTQRPVLSLPLCVQSWRCLQISVCTNKHV